MTSPLELRIERVEAVRLAQELSELTKEPIDDLVVSLLQERLAREKRRLAKLRRDRKLATRQAVIADRVADYPVVDERTPRDSDWIDWGEQRPARAD